MRVLITEPARNHLRDLYNFNALYIPEEKNQELLSAILTKVRLLKTMASRGSVETNLVDAPYQYRYLLEGNCKIIYRIEDDVVLVTDFFDVRQDPSKLTSRQS